MGANCVPGIILRSLQKSLFLILAMTSQDGYYIYPQFILYSLFSIQVTYPEMKEDKAIQSLDKRKLVTLSPNA